MLTSTAADGSGTITRLPVALVKVSVCAPNVPVQTPAASVSDPV